MRIPLMVATGLFLAASGLAAQTAADATAELSNAQGENVGTVQFHQTPRNGVLLDIQVSGLPAGVHAIHIHQTGTCEPPSFESAGGHFAPEGHAHGVLHEEGAHAGDLLNLEVPESGELSTQRLAPHATLEKGAENGLFDDDGSAMIIHMDADDYVSQPSGAAGDRIACGIIQR
ncbi:MAG: superoxide dismutase family protein [Longimicrobiales bacterium]